MRSPRARRIASAALACALAAGACTGAEPELLPPPSGPGAIVLLHGADVAGREGCFGGSAGAWRDLSAALAKAHAGREVVPWGYLACDTGYTHGIDHHGPHDGPGHDTSRWEDGRSHAARASIEHLAVHLAWALYEHDGRHGRATDIVAHSMGGLIARVALAETSAGNEAYPPGLRVRSVVTLGTPHAGTAWARLCAVLGVTQCAEMSPGSALVSRLAAEAPNPQGAGGTAWVLVASDRDRAICAPGPGPASACTLGMEPALRVQYGAAAGIGHSGYARTAGPAPARIAAGDGEWTACEAFPGPVALAVAVAGGDAPASC